MSMRTARQAQSLNGADPAGLKLISALNAYSENGTAYIDTLRRIIRTNRLSGLDAAKLGPGNMTRLIVPRATER